MNEARLEERVQLSYFLKVYERGNQSLLGQVLDITLHGINLLCPEPVPTGAIKNVLLELPDPILGKTRLSLDIESRWCKQDVNPSYFSSGFRFGKTSGRDAEIIYILIANYEFGAELQRAF